MNRFIILLDIDSDDIFPMGYFDIVENTPIYCSYNSDRSEQSLKTWNMAGTLAIL